MEHILSGIALFLIILSTGGFIVYIIRQNNSVFRYAYWVLFTGFLFQTLFLVYRYIALGTVPVINLKMSLAFFAWSIIGAYLLFQVKFRLMVLGSFVAPVAAFFMILSSALPHLPDTVPPVLKGIWLLLHVIPMFLGDGIFAIAFVSSVMYLVQERQIKRKTRGTLFKRLPSLETLDSINHYSLVYGFPLITIGMITGAAYAQAVLGSYWRWDPKEVWSLVTWICYAILLHERLAVGWQGRRSAIMSIFCFMMLIFTFLGGGILLDSYHSFGDFGGGTKLP
ncbi:MAG: c-type cytochrome biogenesis protein CcsB [Deltaproteobacteria bacterium]|nr:c-type cytochrome biogenesis protein CcsB [Deltaproteobacteria bacterium]